MITCTRCKRLIQNDDFVTAKVFTQVKGEQISEKEAMFAIARPRAYSDLCHLYCEYGDPE